MSQQYKSGRQQNLNLGITSVTENKTVLQTIGKVGIGTTNAQNHSLFVVGTTNITGDIYVGGASTFVGVGTFGDSLYVQNQLYVAGLEISGGATVGADIVTRNLLASGISTFNGNIDANGDLDVDGQTELDNLNVSGIATIQSLVVPSGGQFDVYDTTAVFHNNVQVDGNLTINGSQTIVNVQTLNILDKELVLGIGTTPGRETDFSANHGGLAIASTEGSPLVPFAVTGFNTLPDTYKQIMWVKGNTYGVGTTDAWLFNYAVGVGSTLVPNGVRFAVKGIQFTDDEIKAPNVNLSKNLYVSGITTVLSGPVFIGSGTSTGTLNQNLQVTGGGYISSYLGIGYTNPFSNLAIYDTTGSWISLVDPGQSSAAIENNNGTLYIRAEQGSGNSEIVFQTGTSNYEQKPSVSGSDRVIIDKFGNLLINQEATTGVTDQKLQVTGGAFVSGYMGVGTSNPSTNLYVQGNEYVTGVVTATRFYGEFVGTSLSITGVTSTSIISAADLDVTGIATVGALYIGPTQVISSNRDLENITTATLGITSLSQLFVTGVSTFVGVTTNRSTIFGNQLSVSGVSTFNGGLIANSATVQSLTDNRIVLAGVGGLLEDSPNLTFDGQVFNVVGLSTFAGITTVSGDTLFTKQLSVSGLSTFVGIATFNDDVYIQDQLYVGGSTLGVDVVTRNILASGISTFVGITTNQSTIFANQLSVSGVTTHYNNVRLNDSNTLYFGNDNDMRIFHDGGAAYIDNDTGILFYRAGQHFFENAAGTETFASFVSDAAVSLYYDNNKKLETLGTGVTVTGTVYAQNFSTGNSGSGINISSNSITGPSNITIDPAAVGDDTGSVRIRGDLYVDGTQFVVNSTTIEFADFNVGIATTVGTNALLDGAGIGIGSANIVKTFTYNNASNTLQSSIGLGVTTSGEFKTGTDSVLNRTTLGPTVVNSSLTSVGTLIDLNVAGVITATTFNGQVNSGVSTLGIATATNLTAQQLVVSGVSTFQGDVQLGDNDQLILGDGGDLKLVHNGSNSFIQDVGTGALFIDSSTVFNRSNTHTFQNGGGTETLAIFTQNGSVALYYDNSKKFETSGVGATVYGTLDATQLNITGVSTFVGFTTFSNNVSIAGTLDVNGDINFNGSLFQDNQPFIASRWTATSVGNDIYRLSSVGIGTSTLISTLTVSGDTHISGALTARQFVGSVQAGVATLGITTTETLDVYTSSRLRGQIRDTFDNPGASLYVLASGGPSGNWSWQPVTAVGAGILNGIIVQEEGGTVGTAGSITTLDFRGNNVLISADPQPNGIATIRVSDTPNFDSLNVTGLTTVGVVSARSINATGIITASSFRPSSGFYQSANGTNSFFVYDGTGNVAFQGTIGVGQINSGQGYQAITLSGDTKPTVTFVDNGIFGGVVTARQFVGDINAGVATITTINGTNAIFTGNVSIGGTLTYEDVTNVDSIGVITARSDVSVGGNLSVVGITTLASAGGITTTGGDLYVNDDIFFKGNLYQNGQLFAAGIGIGSTSTNPSSGVINPGSRIGVGFTDINIVGTGVSVTGYGTTIVIDFGNINAASGGANVSISSVPPGISTAAGDLWWDNENGDLKIYYSDGNSSQWIDANGGSQSLAIISETSPSGYGVTSAGTLWWDSGYGVLKVYYDDGDSKQWVDANSGAYINYWTAGGPSKIGTTNSVGVGTTNPSEQLQVNGYISIDGNVSYGTTTATTTSIAVVGIHSVLPISTYRSVEYTIQATEGTNFHTTKIIALHDGTTAYHTEYGSIFNNVGVSTYNVDVSGGNIRLLATPTSASTTNFKVTFNGIKV